MSDEQAYPVRLMQTAATPAEAERVRWRLERVLLPNQVLRPGATELVGLLAAGLGTATAAGDLESWELLAQLAAGACPPTAADDRTVTETQRALEAVVPFAAEQVGGPERHASDHLAVDVLDAFLTFGAPPLTDLATTALRTYGARGADELRRVRIVL